MGAKLSASTLRENTFLKDLQDPSKQDITWEGLSSLPPCYPIALSDTTVHEALTQICERIVQHSRGTGRVGAVLRRLSEQVVSSASNRPEQVSYQMVCNQLLLMQQLLKSVFDATHGDGAAVGELCAVPGTGVNGCLLAMDAAVTFTKKHPLLNMNSGSVNAHALALAVLTVSCSSPLYREAEAGAEDELQSCPATPTPFEPTEPIDVLCERGDVGDIVDTLLSFVAKGDYTGSEKSYGSVALLGYLLDAAASLVLPSTVAQQVARQLSLPSRRARHSQQLSAHLGRRAALLLGVLLYRRKNEAKRQPSRLLTWFRDNTTQLSADNIFQALCREGALHNPELVLLFYTALTENQHMLDHIVDDPESGRVGLPLTRLLYGAAELWESPASLYVLLSVLLVLSQYRAFNASMHDITLATVPWFTERPLRKISVGSLLVLSLVRVVQYNISSDQDPYVTKQCLSILSNMGSCMRNLHEYAAQRLVSLAVFLGKRSARPTDDCHVFVDFLRITLGCLHLAVNNSTADNVQLVYELLHQRKGVEEIERLSIASLEAPLSSLIHVITYFSSALERRGGGSVSTVEEVTEVLREAALTWEPAVHSAPTGDRFAFAEEPNPEEFFVPYTWDLAIRYYAPPNGVLDWDTRQLALFSKAIANEEGPIEVVMGGEGHSDI